MPLAYNITRKFPWHWITPVAYAGAFLSIVFLVVINVVLTGYETVTVFNGDFNSTDPHWYDKFMPYRTPEPGSLCDSHVFNVGDSFTTNYTLFEWKIESIVKANAGSSGVSYTGTTLDSCDLTSIYVSGDLRTWTVDFVVAVACRASGKFEVTATTAFSVTSLPGKHSPLLGMARSSSTHVGDPRAIVLDWLVQKATEDVGMRTWAAFSSGDGTSPVLISLQIDFESCPGSLGQLAPCAIAPPNFNISFATSVTANGNLSQYSIYEPDPTQAPVLTPVNTAPLSNLAQMVYAATQLDLGNDSPNNFLLHPEVTDKALATRFPAVGAGVPATDSALYQTWASRTDNEILKNFVPLNVTGPAHIQVVYLCQIQQRKSVGALIIAVLVATLSMFMSGWAAFLFIATYFVTRNDDASNHCTAHEKQDDVTPQGSYATPLQSAYHDETKYVAVKA